MKINDAGKALIKEFEGLRLKAYSCPAGVATVGFGSTGPHVKLGMVITEAEADALLDKDLERFEAGVARLAPNATPNEHSAMVSLAFNIGLKAFEGSTVRKRHNLGNKIGAANAFGMWIRGGGRILPGLVRRREAERKLYLSA
jgi:lysozyme